MPTRALASYGSTGRRWCRSKKTATLKDENVAFFQIGLFRETSDVPETIIIDHVIEATTLKDVTLPRVDARLGSPATDRQSFQKTVQPFLARHCFDCHADKPRGDVRLGQFDEKALAKR